jgi:RNA recognition motif-containing protein
MSRLSNELELHAFVRGLFKQQNHTKSLQSVSTASSPHSHSRLNSLSEVVSSRSIHTVDSLSTNISEAKNDLNSSGIADSRTTLMIKKVPRKYTLDVLRREIDSVLSSSGAYDLLYLPVDSAKMTNRGYAFINFKSPESVQAFIREFSNRPWTELNRRNKAASIHWAYVQGRDATLSHIKTNVLDDRD